MPEIIDYKLLFESSVKISSYSSSDMNGLLELFLQEVLMLTESRRGFIFKYSKADQKVLEISGSVVLIHDSTSGLLPRIFRLLDDGLSEEADSIIGRSIYNQKSQLYLADKDHNTENIVDRYLSVPMEDINRSTLIVLLADKKTDYTISDFNILSKISGTAQRTIKNLNTICDLKLKNELEYEKVKNKDSFIRFISHEIKTPLNSITGFSQLLREDNQSVESFNKFIDIILDSSNKLVRFINSVNEISDIQTGQLKIAEGDVNLGHLFSEIYEQFKSEASVKKLKFQVHNSIPEADSFILADREKLKRVITELLTNSFQHTFTGSVTTGCELKDGSIDFFVMDTGMGIHDDLKSKVFQQLFNSGDSTLKSSQGAGLGLTISKEFVEHMGGKIRFDSSEGIGTNFFFSIPYKKYVSENVSDTSIRKGGSDNKQEKKSILVAEDDNMNFFLIKVYLAKLDYNLIRAMNGREAVELCKSSHFDLVLMDIRMPDMDGYTATKKIKKINPQQIVIAQTAYTSDRDTALANGCDDFIAKPFGQKQLITLIRNFI